MSTFSQTTERLLRLPEVLQQTAVSKSTWWAGVKDGKFPQPIKLGPRTTTWSSKQINALVKFGLNWKEEIDRG
jgi:predicted DNA-binding transcriptional regulator AlpA